MTVALDGARVERGWPPAELEELENRTVAADFAQMCIDVSKEIEFDRQELTDHPLAFRGIISQIRSKSMKYQYVPESGQFDQDIVVPILGALDLSANYVAASQVNINNLSLSALRFSNGGLYSGFNKIRSTASKQDIVLRTANLVNAWTADATDGQRLTLLSGLLAVRGINLDFLKFGDTGKATARIQGGDEMSLPLVQNTASVEAMAVEYGTYYEATK